MSEKRVAVGRRLGDDGRGDGAACAGTIFDDQRLLPIFADFGCDQARQRVGRAAGRECDDEADRLDGIRLLFLPDRG